MTRGMHRQVQGSDNSPEYSMSRFRVILISGIAALAVAVACSDDSTSPHPSVLAGLAAGKSNDTTVGQPGPGSTQPGSFHGYVLGHGVGPDTFATAPRIQNATITAYPHLGYDGDTPLVGDPAGTVKTDANGFFQFPTIPGGAYVITVTPPAGSDYRGQYITGTISEVSNSGTWWVVLSKQ